MISPEQAQHFQKAYVLPPIAIERTREKQEFTQRFTTALQEPPIQGILFANEQWTPLFLEGVARVDAACQQRQICHHGLEHLIQVSHNALTLIDMVQGTGNDITTRRRNQRTQKYTDAEVIFPALTHDLGYGFKTVVWEGFDAINHAEQGTEVMQRFRRRFLSEKVDPSHESFQALEQHAQLYQYTISANAKKMLVYATECAEVETVTPRMMFPLVVMVADKLDYFRDKRVEGLTPPKRYEDNPYFFLADAVETYTLIDIGSSLQFQVKLKRGYNIPTFEGDIRLSFSKWKEETKNAYGGVWQLTADFANVLGKRFEISD